MECIVCAYEIDCSERFPALSACGHNDLCSLCSLKIRALQRNMCCVTCKRELEHVICSEKKDARFEDFPMWGDSIGPEFVLDQKSQMFFPAEYYKNKIQKLWVHKCSVCSRVFRDVKALKAHVSNDHNMHICMHCVDNKQEFPAEQRIYTQKQYETHLREGDQDGSQGHPNCEFCKKRYYDSTALFVHLNKDHYNCHLCEKAGVKFKYYKDYKNLELHFRQNHLLCEDPGCLARKFIVFDNEIDMEVHNRKYHPTFTMKRATTLKLDFKVARNTAGSSGNGRGEEGGPSLKMGGDSNEEEEHAVSSMDRHGHGHGHGRYEGGMGGRERNGEWQVELAPISSDPRDVNRNMNMVVSPVAQASDAFVEEFPSLQSSSAGSSGPITLTNKWVSLNNNVGTIGKKGKKNDFPALQSRKPSGAGSGHGSSNRVQAGSTLSAIQKEYSSMSSDAPQAPRGNATGSLGDWARIKVDKRAPKATAKSTPRTTAAAPSSSISAAGMGVDFEDSMAIALAESLSDTYSAPLPAPVPTPAPAPVQTSMYNPPAPPAEAYPALSSSVPTPPQPKPAPKKKPGKSTASGGWSEALSSMGLATTGNSSKTAPKKKLTVVKTSTSNSSLSKLGESGSGSNSPTPESGDAAIGPPGMNWDNLKPIGKRSAGNNEEWRATSALVPSKGSSGAATTTTVGNKKYGGWVKIGGAGKEHGGVDSAPTAPLPYKSEKDYPSLSTGSRY